MGQSTQLTSNTPPASCYCRAVRVLHFSAFIIHRRRKMSQVGGGGSQEK